MRFENRTQRPARTDDEDDDEHEREMRDECGVRVRLKAALHAALPLESYGERGRSFGARVKEWRFCLPP